MPEDSRSVHAGVGFRVKSGWATAVLVTGSIRSPQALARCRIDLCDPSVPGSSQPFHARMGTLQTDEAKVKRLRQVIIRATSQSVTELIAGYRRAGHRLHAGCLVVGSVIDPDKITNPHIRAHALEGRLFRTVLEDALGSFGLTCSVIIERSAYAQAANILKRPEDDIKSCVAQLGRSLEGPWRADEKTACLAGWLALA